jgi:protease-4
MRRTVAFLVLVLGAGGCLRPIGTNSRLAFDNPLTLRASAEIQPRSDTGPLLEMPVDGPPCRPGEPKVALIDADGLLLNQNVTGPYSTGENPVDLFREKLDQAAADCRVCAIVVRINSPGGSVTASDVLWRELQAFRARTQRPVVACLMDLGCGGAYYLATASDVIVAHPTTITGGIGVVLNLYNLRELMGLINIQPQLIRSGKYIDMGSLTSPLNEETRQLLQTMADEMHARFRAVVRQQRPGIDITDASTFDGRVFTAGQALDRRLIDRIGYLEDAVALARELGGQPAARTVLYRRRDDPARTPYATTPNVPLQATLFPVSVPGVERSRLPTFLYLWQPDPTMQRLGGQ